MEHINLNFSAHESRLLWPRAYYTLLFWDHRVLFSQAQNEPRESQESCFYQKTHKGLESFPIFCYTLWQFAVYLLRNYITMSRARSVQTRRSGADATIVFINTMIFHHERCSFSLTTQSTMWIWMEQGKNAKIHNVHDRVVKYKTFFVLRRCRRASELENSKLLFVDYF
jgi:hypothetical protein